MSVPPDNVLQQFSSDSPWGGTTPSLDPSQSQATQLPPPQSPMSVVPGLQNDINQLSDRQSQIVEAEQGQTQQVIQQLASMQGQQPQRNMDKVMNAAPLFIALAAIGGKATRLHSTAMLGAVNGAVSGMLKGNEQAFEDNWKKFTDNKNSLLQMYELQKQYYDTMYKSYGQQIQNKEKAIQVARDLSNDQWNHDLKQQQLIEKGQMDQIRAWDMQQRHLDRVAQMDEQKWIAEMRVQMAHMNGGKPPSGYQWSPDGQSLVPIPGGPKDPGATTPLTAQQRTTLTRATAAANMSLRDIQNVVQLPITGSSGILGGVKNEGTISTATKAALANEMNPEQNQMYVTLMTGIEQNMSILESDGYAPRGSTTEAMKRLNVGPGDTNLVKLTKMAQVRQIVESSLSAQLKNPAVPQWQRDHIQSMISQYQQAIPWQVDDVVHLMNSDNPQVTIMDFAKSRNVGDVNGTQAQGQSEAVVRPETQDQGPPEATATLGGKPYVKRGGQWYEVTSAGTASQ